MYRVALSIAHGKRISGKFDPGAGSHQGVTEHAVSQAITVSLRQLMEYSPEMFPVLLPFPRDLKEKVAMVNQGGEAGPFDLAIEIHVNAHRNPEAKGTEVWYLGAEEEASIFQHHLVSHLGTKDRGIKQHRFYFLRNTKPKALIVEPEFIHNVWAMCTSGIYHAEVALACYRAIMEITGSGVYSYGRGGAPKVEEAGSVSLTVE